MIKTHASLFSGIGAAEIAADWMGWQNAFHCEIQEFPRRVLDYWYPNSVSYEDITKTDFTPWRGKIDILTAGFPCQPFSCAGQRKGADDDRNTCAAVVVAQSLAHEAAEYVKRRAAKFTNFTITTHDGRRMSVSSSLASMSCAGIDFCLKNIARMLIEKHLPHDVDLAADPSVMTGLKAVLNTMADPKTWAYARDKADSLNEEKNNKM